MSGVWLTIRFPWSSNTTGGSARRTSANVGDGTKSTPAALLRPRVTTTMYVVFCSSGANGTTVTEFTVAGIVQSAAENRTVVPTIGIVGISVGGDVLNSRMLVAVE